MPYVDANAGKSRKLLTSGAVALLQAGLVLAVIKGFTVAFVQTEPPRHLPSQTFPTAPMPDPVETPRVDPEPQATRESVIERRVTPVPANDPVDTEPWVPATSGTGTLTDVVIVPQVDPVDPPPRYAPKAAMPRGAISAWVTTDDYPAADLRMGHTGTVRFRLAIDENGRVASCAITEPSGYPGLDAATCRHVTRRARFDPATGADGQRVAGSYAGTIRWMIPRD